MSWSEKSSHCYILELLNMSEFLVWIRNLLWAGGVMWVLKQADLCKFQVRFIAWGRFLQLQQPTSPFVSFSFAQRAAPWMLITIACQPWCFRASQLDKLCLEKSFHGSRGCTAELSTRCQMHIMTCHQHCKLELKHDASTVLDCIVPMKTCIARSRL